MAPVGGHVVPPPSSPIAHHHGCSADRQCALDHRKGYMMQPRIHPSPLPSPLLTLFLSRLLALCSCLPLSSFLPRCASSFCLLTPLIPTRLCLYLFLHSPLQRRLKYLHDQIERYCAESRDLWSNAGKIGRAGAGEGESKHHGCNCRDIPVHTSAL